MSFYNRLLKWAEKICDEDEKTSKSETNQRVYDTLRDEAITRASDGETCKNCKFCEIKFGWGWSYDKYYCTKHNIDLKNDDSGYYLVQFYDKRYRAQSCDDYKYNWTNDHTRS